MFVTAISLFFAGALTIFLPCILPLIPIVLGVSIANNNKWRPLVTIIGMIIGFVGFTFMLQVLLRQFVVLADYIRIGTFYALFLFGIGFAIQNKNLAYILGIIGSIFFIEKGILAVIIAAIFGSIALHIGGHIATKIQQLGTNVQQVTNTTIGKDSLITAFIIGLTMGLVWVPCAGPALSFALTLVRDEPGLKALIYLSIYGIGAGIPLVIIGYGGQYILHSVRSLNRFTGRIKQVSGIILILSAIALQYNVIKTIETWLVNNTSYGIFATQLEETIFSPENSTSKSSIVSTITQDSTLPILKNGPESFVGLGTWFNSPALTLEELKGKVVLVDFWTYSCINCIRTLPYVEALSQKYKDAPVVVIGVHTPEFIFEKDSKNVQTAINKHGLTYPIVQDNDYATWKAFENHYWPAKYLLDAQGNIRYTHFGEGKYEETDMAIASLLKEMNVSTDQNTPLVSNSAAQNVANQPVTPEIYFGPRSWENFYNSKISHSPQNIGNHSYSFPTPFVPELHTYYLEGNWQLTDDKEHQILQSDTGQIYIKALAGEANIVFGLNPEITSVRADIIVDGKATKSIVIDSPDLYNIYKGDYGQHDIRIQLFGQGVQAYAFTFGR